MKRFYTKETIRVYKDFTIALAEIPILFLIGWDEEKGWLFEMQIPRLIDICGITQNASISVLLY